MKVSSFHHWDRLLDVREGDIIFHGCDACVQAISTARGECYECHQPEELRSEDLWEPDGRRVDCDYILIDNPIKTALVRDDILRLCNVKYAPFDRDGNGNMGYLYELPRELAKLVSFYYIIAYTRMAQTEMFTVWAIYFCCSTHFFIFI